MNPRLHMTCSALALLAFCLPVSGQVGITEKALITGAAVDVANDYALIGDASVTGNNPAIKRLKLSEFGNIPGFLSGKEPGLGNPAGNGYVLQSTTAGVRSWAAMTSNLTSGPVTSSGGVSAIADGALTIAKTSGLQTALGLGKSTMKLVVEGDSISTYAGMSSGQEWGTLLSTLPSCAGCTYVNGATVSQGITQMQTDYAAQIYPHRPNGTTVTRSVLTFFPGANNCYAAANEPLSAAAFMAKWNAYVTTAKADGFEVVAFTIPHFYYTGILPSDEATRLEINRQIRESALPNYLIEMDTLLGDLDNPANTWHQGDRLHPNALGHMVIAREIDRVLRGAPDTRSRGIVTLGQMYGNAAYEKAWLSGRFINYNMNLNSWVSTVTGTGAANNFGQNFWMATGATATSTVNMQADSGAIGGFGLPGSDPRYVYWGARKRIEIKFYVIGSTANAVRRFQYGAFYNATVPGALDHAGVGLKIENMAVKLETHNGTTGALSATLATISANSIEDWIIDSVGNGKVEVTRNGTLLGTYTGGPSATGAVNYNNVVISATNGADAAAIYLVPLQIRVIAD